MAVLQLCLWLVYCRTIMKDLKNPDLPQLVRRDWQAREAQDLSDIVQRRLKQPAGEGTGNTQVAFIVISSPSLCPRPPYMPLFSLRVSPPYVSTPFLRVSSSLLVPFLLTCPLPPYLSPSLLTCPVFHPPCVSHSSLRVPYFHTLLSLLTCPPPYVSPPNRSPDIPFVVVLLKVTWHNSSLAQSCYWRKSPDITQRSFLRAKQFLHRLLV